LDRLPTDRTGILRYAADKDGFDQVHGQILPDPARRLFGVRVIEFRNADRADQLQTSSLDFEPLQFMDRPDHAVEESGHASKSLMHFSNAIERHPRGETLAGAAVEHLPHLSDNALAVIAIEAQRQVSRPAVSVKRLRDVGQVTPKFRAAAGEGDLQRRPKGSREGVDLRQVQFAEAPVVELPPEEAMAALCVAPMSDKEQHVSRQPDADTKETSAGSQLVDESVHGWGLTLAGCVAYG